MTRRYAMLVKEKKPGKFLKRREKEQRKEHTETRPLQRSHTPSQHHLAANTSKCFRKGNYSNAGYTHTKIIRCYFCVSHRRVSLTKRQVEALQLTPLQVLKGIYSSWPLLWAVEMYTQQHSSWNSSEALPSLLPRKAKHSQCLFELNLWF